ncbi:MAG: diacylglycerol kinase family protein [Planctomycetota bacterium]
MKQAAVVYNQRAGRGCPEGAASRALLVAEALARTGWSVQEPMPTEGPRHAVELAAGLPDEVSRLVVLGGDGTLREAAEGLLDGSREASLGFLPVGNGNVLARELRIPLFDLDRALQIAVSDQVVSLDVGRANGKLFLAMVGVGFDALVTRWVDRVRAGRLGDWIYRKLPDGLFVANGILALLRFLPTRFDVETDGRKAAERAGSVIVANTATYAKGWAVARDASPFDGRLDAVLLRHAMGPLAAWPLLRAKARQPYGPFFGQVVRAESITIRSDRPFFWQADGDPMGAVEQLLIGIEPGALRIAAGGQAAD